MATTIQTSTRSESARNLISANAILYIRPITLTITVTGCRPNTPMNVFFDSVYMNHRATALDNTSNLITDSNGSLVFTLDIPGGTFNTGDKTIVITDADTLANAYITGSVYGTATTHFTSSGTQQIYENITTITSQNTVTTDQTLPPPPPPPPPPPQPQPETSDPLAQSFFTYGKNGGCFLTSIDLYFNTKDPSIPVSVELRDMVNGYPSSEMAASSDYVVYKNAADVAVSDNATAVTNFRFKYPIYLQQDKDYCFVVKSNTNKYNLFTSRMGEKSFETNKTIFEQPFVGTLFKSSNNKTWDAEQFEDIKFTLKIANFDTNSGAVLNIAAQANHFAIPSAYFTTVSASNTVRMYQPQKHGLEVNSKIDLVADTGATYNGIPASSITGTRTVTNVVDEFTIEFMATTSGGNPSNANTTGSVASGGQLKRILVTNGGSGYTTAPHVSFSSLSGVGAAATAIIKDGSVIAVDVTNSGSGYVTPPTIIFTDGNGLGVEAVALTDGMISVTTNKPTNFLIPNIPVKAITGTDITATVSTTQLNYDGGNLTTYQPAETLPLNTSGKTHLSINAAVVSPQNEAALMGGNHSFLTQYIMSTTNPNVSPVIDLRNNPSFTAYSYRISNQVNEDILGSSNTELTANAGSSLARYLTKKNGLSTPSKGILVTSAIYSDASTSVEWYVRTSLSGTTANHEDLGWQLLTCDVDRNKSVKPGQYWDYEFYLYDIPEFDTYDLKCVMRSSNPAKTPIVQNYRVIVTA